MGLEISQVHRLFMSNGMDWTQAYYEICCAAYSGSVNLQPVTTRAPQSQPNKWPRLYPAGASYVIGTVGTYVGGKAVKAWTWTFNYFHLTLRLRRRGAASSLPPPNMSSWCDILLSKRYVFRTWYLVKHRDLFYPTSSSFYRSIVKELFWVSDVFHPTDMN